MTGTQPEDLTAYLTQIRDRGYRNGAMGARAYRLSDCASIDVPRLLAAVEAALKHHQPGKLPWCDACGPQHQPCQEVADIRRALLGEGESGA